MIEALFSFGIALVITALSGVLLLPALRYLKFGQSIREEGPSWHKAKSGTPTMGGFLFMVGIVAAVLIMGWPLMKEGDYRHLFILVFALLFGVIGFVDDLCKVKKKQNLGLTSLQKLLLQLAAAAAFIAVLRYFGYLQTEIYIPFFDVTFQVNLVVYVTVSLLVVAGMVNAVNLTDGLDGLCSGVSFPVACFFAILGVALGKGGLTVFAAALAGGLIGFLLYNFHPAKVFMGDTGSLFLGGAVCGMGFVSGVPLLLIVVGGVFIWEMLSVILQVLYFKATKGKRIFKMSPFHHHLEMSGWNEIKIFTVFTAVTVVLCILGWLGVSNILRV